MKNLRPEIRVIGVEPVDSDAMRRSIMAGHRVELKDVGLFADGVAVKLVGEETFALCRDLLDDIITVDTDAICGAIKDIFEDTRVVAEPVCVPMPARATCATPPWWPWSAAPT